MDTGDEEEVTGISPDTAILVAAATGVGPIPEVVAHILQHAAHDHSSSLAGEDHMDTRRESDPKGEVYEVDTKLNEVLACVRRVCEALAKEDFSKPTASIVERDAEQMSGLQDEEEEEDEDKVIDPGFKQGGSAEEEEGDYAEEDEGESAEEWRAIDVDVATFLYDGPDYMMSYDEEMSVESSSGEDEELDASDVHSDAQTPATQIAVVEYPFMLACVCADHCHARRSRHYIPPCAEACVVGTCDGEPASDSIFSTLVGGYEANYDSQFTLTQDKYDTAIQIAATVLEPQTAKTPIILTLGDKVPPAVKLGAVHADVKKKIKKLWKPSDDSPQSYLITTKVLLPIHKNRSGEVIVRKPREAGGIIPTGFSVSDAASTKEIPLTSVRWVQTSEDGLGKMVLVLPEDLKIDVKELYLVGHRITTDETVVPMDPDELRVARLLSHVGAMSICIPAKAQYETLQYFSGALGLSYMQSFLQTPAYSNEKTVRKALFKEITTTPETALLLLLGLLLSPWVRRHPTKQHKTSLEIITTTAESASMEPKRKTAALPIRFENVLAQQAFAFCAEIISHGALAQTWEEEFWSQLSLPPPFPTQPQAYKDAYSKIPEPDAKGLPSTLDAMTTERLCCDAICIASEAFSRSLNACVHKCEAFLHTASIEEVEATTQSTEQEASPHTASIEEVEAIAQSTERLLRALPLMTPLALLGHYADFSLFTKVSAIADMLDLSDALYLLTELQKVYRVYRTIAVFYKLQKPKKSKIMSRINQVLADDVHKSTTANVPLGFCAVQTLLQFLNTNMPSRDTWKSTDGLKKSMATVLAHEAASLLYAEDVLEATGKRDSVAYLNPSIPCVLARLCAPGDIRLLEQPKLVEVIKGWVPREDVTAPCASVIGFLALCTAASSQAHGDIPHTHNPGAHDSTDSMHADSPASSTGAGSEASNEPHTYSSGYESTSPAAATDSKMQSAGEEDEEEIEEESEEDSEEESEGDTDEGGTSDEEAADTTPSSMVVDGPVDGATVDMVAPVATQARKTRPPPPPLTPTDALARIALLFPAKMEDVPAASSVHNGADKKLSNVLTQQTEAVIAMCPPAVLEEWALDGCATFIRDLADAMDSALSHCTEPLMTVLRDRAKGVVTPLIASTLIKMPASIATGDSGPADAEYARRILALAVGTTVQGNRKKYALPPFLAHLAAALSNVLVDRIARFRNNPASAPGANFNLRTRSGQKFALDVTSTSISSLVAQDKVMQAILSQIPELRASGGSTLAIPLPKEMLRNMDIASRAVILSPLLSRVLQEYDMGLVAKCRQVYFLLYATHGQSGLPEAIDEHEKSMCSQGYNELHEMGMKRQKTVKTFIKEAEDAVRNGRLTLSILTKALSGTLAPQPLTLANPIKCLDMFLVGFMSGGNLHPLQKKNIARFEKLLSQAAHSVSRALPAAHLIVREYQDKLMESTKALAEHATASTPTTAAAAVPADPLSDLQRLRTEIVKYFVYYEIANAIVSRNLPEWVPKFASALGLDLATLTRESTGSVLSIVKTIASVCAEPWSISILLKRNVSDLENVCDAWKTAAANPLGHKTRLPSCILGDELISDHFVDTMELAGFFVRSQGKSGTSRWSKTWFCAGNEWSEREINLDQPSGLPLFTKNRIMATIGQTALGGGARGMSPNDAKTVGMAGIASRSITRIIADGALLAGRGVNDTVMSDDVALDAVHKEFAEGYTWYKNQTGDAHPYGILAAECHRNALETRATLEYYRARAQAEADAETQGGAQAEADAETQGGALKLSFIKSRREDIKSRLAANEMKAREDARVEEEERSIGKAVTDFANFVASSACRESARFLDAPEAYYCQRLIEADRTMRETHGGPPILLEKVLREASNKYAHGRELTFDELWEFNLEDLFDAVRASAYLRTLLDNKLVVTDDDISPRASLAMGTLLTLQPAWWDDDTILLLRKCKARKIQAKVYVTDLATPIDALVYTGTLLQLEDLLSENSDVTLQTLNQMCAKDVFSKGMAKAIAPFDTLYAVKFVPLGKFQLQETFTAMVDTYATKITPALLEIYRLAFRCIRAQTVMKLDWGEVSKETKQDLKACNWDQIKCILQATFTGATEEPDAVVQKIAEQLRTRGFPAGMSAVLRRIRKLSPDVRGVRLSIAREKRNRGFTDKLTDLLAIHVLPHGAPRFNSTGAAVWNALENDEDMPLAASLTPTELWGFANDLVAEAKGRDYHMEYQQSPTLLVYWKIHRAPTKPDAKNAGAPTKAGKADKNEQAWNAAQIKLNRAINKAAETSIQAHIRFALLILRLMDRPDDMQPPTFSIPRDELAAYLEGTSAQQIHIPSHQMLSSSLQSLSTRNLPLNHLACIMRVASAILDTPKKVELGNEQVQPLKDFIEKVLCGETPPHRSLLQGIKFRSVAVSADSLRQQALENAHPVDMWVTVLTALAQFSRRPSPTPHIAPALQPTTHNASTNKRIAEEGPNESTRDEEEGDDSRVSEPTKLADPDADEGWPADWGGQNEKKQRTTPPDDPRASAIAVSDGEEEEEEEEEEDPIILFPGESMLKGDDGDGSPDKKTTPPDVPRTSAIMVSNEEEEEDPINLSRASAIMVSDEEEEEDPINLFTGNGMIEEDDGDGSPDQKRPRYRAREGRKGVMPVHVGMDTLCKEYVIGRPVESHLDGTCKLGTTTVYLKAGANVTQAMQTEIISLTGLSHLAGACRYVIRLLGSYVDPDAIDSITVRVTLGYAMAFDPHGETADKIIRETQHFKTGIVKKVREEGRAGLEFLHRMGFLHGAPTLRNLVVTGETCELTTPEDHPFKWTAFHKILQSPTPEEQASEIDAFEQAVKRVHEAPTSS
jgi:hypothetical protein